MIKERVDGMMAKFAEERRQKVRTMVHHGHCTDCPWRGPKGMTAALEYEVHYAIEHQLREFVAGCTESWGPP